MSGPRTFYSDHDAPALDVSVESRLRRLDPNLRLTWSKWEVHPQTSMPLQDADGNYIRVREPDGKPSARWHLWSKTGERWYYVRQYARFDHIQVAHLEGDPARFKSPVQIAREGRQFREDELEKGYDDFTTLADDVREANGGLIERALDLERQGRQSELGTRQGLIMSFPGQANRSTPGLVTKDAREEGWETPQRG